MVQALFLIISLFFSYKIISKRGYKKVCWFLSSILFFPSSISLFTFPVVVTFPRLMTYVMLFSTIFGAKNWQQQLKELPFRKALHFLLLMLLIIGVFDSRLNPFLKLYRPITYYIESFFILFLTFYHIKNVRDVHLVFKVLLYFFVLFGLYGISNYFTKSSDYYHIISQAYGGRDFAKDNMAAGIERFRISSFTWHAIYYGFLLAIVILVNVYLLYVRKVKGKLKVLAFVILFLLIINLLLVNSRTPISALLAGLSVLFLISIKFKNKVKLLMGGAILLLVIFTFIPNSSKIITDTFDTFTSKGSDVAGSSVEMRASQMAASLKVFINSPITGNGFNFITEGLGFSSDENKSRSDGDLWGFESYSYKLVIEQGLCGIIGNLIFFISLFVFFIKKYKSNNKESRNLAALSISLLVTFLLFIFGTGDMQTFPFLLSIIGVTTKAILLVEKEATEKLLEVTSPLDLNFA